MFRTAQSVVLIGILLLAGCSAAPSGTTPTPTASPTAPTASPTTQVPTSEITTTIGPTDTPPRRTLRTPTRPWDMTYRLENGTLVVERGVSPNETGSTPEGRALYECEWTGVVAVVEYLNEETDLDLQGVRAGVEHDDFIYVTRTTILTRDGEIHEEPNVGFQELEDATPDQAKITLRYNLETYTCTPPIVVRNETIQQA